MPNRSSERRAGMRDSRVLRAVFLAGAVADAVALLPMLLPSLATLLWGLRDASDSYRLAMRCGAGSTCPRRIDGGSTSRWPAPSSPFTSRTPASCTRGTTHIRRQREVTSDDELRHL